MTRSITRPRPAGPDSQVTYAPTAGQSPATSSTRRSPSTHDGQRLVSYQRRSTSWTVPATVWVAADRAHGADYRLAWAGERVRSRSAMAEPLPDNIEPYPDISSKAYEHPADRAATAALKAVPMLDTVVRKLIEWGYERALRQFFLGNSVKVGEHQLPDLWASHVGVCRILDMPTSTTCMSTSACSAAPRRSGRQADGRHRLPAAAGLGPGEQRVVLAHELGHILSDHVLYMTALNILLSVAVPLPFLLGIPFRAVRAVLLEWYRAAELSCDRAATLAVRDPRIVCRTLMVLGAGMPADQLNLDAFMAQAHGVREPGTTRATASGASSTRSARLTRYAVRRVSEVMKWVQSGDYDRIQRGEYRTRDEATNVREEAGDAVEFYAERFRTIFRETGDNLTKAGTQIGGVAEQVADWIRTRGGPGGGGGSGSGGPGVRRDQLRRVRRARSPRGGLHGGDDVGDEPTTRRRPARAPRAARGHSSHVTGPRAACSNSASQLVRHIATTDDRSIRPSRLTSRHISDISLQCRCVRRDKHELRSEAAPGPSGPLAMMKGGDPRHRTRAPGAAGRAAPAGRAVRRRRPMWGRGGPFGGGRGRGRAPRRRPHGAADAARRGAAQRLPADADDRGAQRRALAPEPRLGLPRRSPSSRTRA